jgi:nucleoside-diphosphate-sugar epimerase
VVHANLRALTAPKLSGEVVNVALGGRITLNALYAMIASELKVQLAPVHGPARVGDVRDSQADISRARALLGYEMRVSVEDGMRRTVEWYRTFRAGRG